MKDEIKNFKMGSGSTFCSEASSGVDLASGTLARHQRSLLDTMRFSFRETWNEKDGLPTTQKVIFKESPTMKY